MKTLMIIKHVTIAAETIKPDHKVNQSESIIRRIIITVNGFYALHTVKKRNKRIGSTFWTTVRKLKELQSKSKYHWIGKGLTIPTIYFF